MKISNLYMILAALCLSVLCVGMANAGLENITVGYSWTNSSTTAWEGGVWNISSPYVGVGNVIYLETVTRPAGSGANAIRLLETTSGIVINESNNSITGDVFYVHWNITANSSYRIETRNSTGGSYFQFFNAGPTTWNIGNMTMSSKGSANGANNSNWFNIRDVQINASNITPLITTTFTIAAFDNITGLSISTFNASIIFNGTNTSYSTTNGTIVTNITNATNPANVTLMSAGYFNLTNLSLNTNTSFSAFMQPFSINISFWAYEIISNSSISGYTLKINSTTYSVQINVSGTNTTFVLPFGTYNATFNKTGWFNNTNYGFIINSSSINISERNNSAYIINITAKNTITGLSVSNFTINITSGLYSYRQTALNTTNGSIVIPWANDTNVNITLYNSQEVSSTSILWNTSNYTTPAYVNVQIQSASYNSILFNIFDESTTRLINTTTVSLFLTSSIISYNFSTANGTYYASLLSPLTYVITYNASGYQQRTYTFTLGNQTTNTLNLYLLPYTNATVISLYVLDENNNPVQGAVIYQSRKNISSTTYFTVGTCTTDANGQCLVSIQVNDPIYRFTIFVNNVSLGDSGDTQIAAGVTAKYFNVRLSANTLGTFFGIAGSSANLTMYSNGTVYYAFYDSSGGTNTGCLNINRRTGATVSRINRSCSTSSSVFTIIIDNVNYTLGDEIIAQGTVFIGPDEYLVSQKSVLNTNNSGIPSYAKPWILFYVVMAVMMTLILKYSWSPTGSVMMVGITTLAFWLIGFIDITQGAITAGFIVIFIIISSSLS